MMTVVSLFAGVGGFDLAFQRAGATVVAAVEIDKPALTVLERRFPDTALFPDVTKVTADELRAVGFVPERGIITAGFPCQDISIAGRRVGLAGARSGLFWEIVRLLDALHPAWIVLENVPNLLSINDGKDMGAVVGALGELGYGWAYRVLDAQFFGVPQRRRRVFIVGHLGTPFGAAAEVLFEPESGGRDSAPSRTSGSRLAPTLESGANSTGGTRPPGTTVDTAESLITAADYTHTRTRSPLCRAAGSAATGSTPSRRRAGISSSVVAALTARGGKGVDSDANGIIVQSTANDRVVAPLLSAYRGVPSTDEADQLVVSIHENQRGELTTNATTSALTTGGGKPGQGYPAVLDEAAVRRLTPLECERLQGYPDNWTDDQSDAQRYRQMGNSLAVPVVEWIAQRLIAVDSGVSHRYKEGEA